MDSSKGVDRRIGNSAAGVSGRRKNLSDGMDKRMEDFAAVMTGRGMNSGRSLGMLWIMLGGGDVGGDWMETPDGRDSMMLGDGRGSTVGMYGR